MRIYFPGEHNLGNVTDMCIAAHQDDIEIMAYAPISECYDNPERSFAGVVATDGAGSPRSGEYADYTDEQMKEVRISEQEKAADIGRYKAAIQLGFPSNAIKNPDNAEPVEEIKKLLLETRPRFLYTHNPADKHETHVAVALRTIEAVRQLKGEYVPEKFIGLEVWRSLDWITDEAKICLDTSAYPEVARELVTVHRSQVLGGKRYDHAAIGRRYANATFFASHSTDNITSMSFGIDLMPVIEQNMSVREYVNGYINKFKDEVNTTIGKLDKND